MTRLKLVCATSLTQGDTAFSTIGHVINLPEESIRRDDLVDADALITRSKTRINDALLDGTGIRFYGTATAGIDHIDTTALTRRGITWAHAPGANADSVAHYVIAVLSRLQKDHPGLIAPGHTLGIIGAGAVGSRLAEVATALELKTLLNDPPLLAATGDQERYRPLDEVLATADILSIHVPLTHDGPYPTRGLINPSFLDRVKPGCVLINTSRGEVTCGPALIQAVRHHRLAALALDVFPGEPNLDPALLDATTLATPHIAGYSREGRINGTETIYRAACRFFNITPTWQPEHSSGEILIAPPHPPATVADAVLAVYDPAHDDRALRTPTAPPPTATNFQNLRRHYPDRREFTAFRLAANALTPKTQTALRLLGFHLFTEPPTR